MTITVQIQRSATGFTLSSEAGVITLQTSCPELLNTQAHDFAAWYFLPIAMREAQDLHIAGTGRRMTVQNAERMSEIWGGWLPEKFSPVRLTFAACDDSTPPEAADQPELSFFSGGVDSSYSILKRHEQGMARDLLTVHGMDYHTGDNERFERFLAMTGLLANQVSNRRIIVRSDAYSLYDRYMVDPHDGHISHIFSLAGAAYMFSERYRRIVIAADYRLDQQVMAFPYGSNSITNPLFADGITQLLTDGDDVTRTEKAAFLTGRPAILPSLTFCTNKESRPYNCGTCQKCVRTKLMFFIASGQIPAIFRDNSLGERPLSAFDVTKKLQRTFLLELLIHAERRGSLDMIPDGASTLQSFRTGSLHSRFKESQLRRSLRRAARGLLKRLKPAR